MRRKTNRERNENRDKDGCIGEAVNGCRREGGKEEEEGGRRGGGRGRYREYIGYVWKTMKLNTGEGGEYRIGVELMRWANWKEPT